MDIFVKICRLFAGIAIICMISISCGRSKPQTSELPEQTFLNRTISEYATKDNGLLIQFDRSHNTYMLFFRDSTQTDGNWREDPGQRGTFTEQKLDEGTVICRLTLNDLYEKKFGSIYKVVINLKDGSAMFSSANNMINASDITSENAPKNVVVESSMPSTTDMDKKFITTMKQVYMCNENSICPETERFKDYSFRLDYDLILQSQDPSPVEVEISKTGNDRFTAKWKSVYGGENIQISFIVVQEDGEWKIDNVIEEGIGEFSSKEPKFDYSKAASFYNAYEY